MNLLKISAVPALALFAFLVTAPVGASAQQPAPPGEGVRDTITAFPLDTLRVSGRVDDLIGLAATSSEGRVGAADLRTRPLAREGELLETVPGVIVTQHSGEGKANQYFVRGFNLDHGTDFQTRVEGMPINMPTHGHGQGYTDLNFLIPEFVDLLEYRLGVYHTELGDFGSAGGAEFHLLRDLDRPFLSATGGQNGFGRLVGGAATSVSDGRLLVGGEARLYDGPWDLPQDVRKLNGLARYSRDLGSTRYSILALGYAGKWAATDQIPMRAVESGLIGRFGNIDPTDGGEARRFSLSGGLSRFGAAFSQDVELFVIRSDLELFSNFTYFLEDEEEGDQFEQRDDRMILGMAARHAQNVVGLGAAHTLTAGVEGRLDLIGEVGLHRATDRIRTGTIRDDEVTQASGGLFLEATSRWNAALRTVLGIRADGFSFDVESDLPANSGTRRTGIVSPSGSVVWTAARDIELYLSGGLGFHSNDARGVTIMVEPETGEPVDPVDPLVRSSGGEVGIRAVVLDGLRSTFTLWALELDSELIFEGDAGMTEPSDRSRRTGVTLANFYRPIPSLSIDADLSLARARLLEVDEGEDRIPGALERVLASGVAWVPPQGAFGSIRMRHFGEYPLVEDNSVRAEPATLFNAELGYRLPSGLRLQATLLNVLDAEAYDIQYFYESRLPGEPASGVEDIHFHPVEPRQLRFTVHWEF
jgi:outer membrane receptor protein involved in Fe transport